MFYIMNNIKEKEILQCMLDGKREELISRLSIFALEHGITGNLWKGYILYVLIFNDNPYTRSIERKGMSNIIEAVLHDLQEYYDLYSRKLDIPMLEGFIYKSKDTIIGDTIVDMQSNIASYEAFKQKILSFYLKNGIGEMALYEAFRIEEGKLFPILSLKDVSFDDLIGYEEQKRMLRENTEAFLNHMPYNNVLLYGSSGTGKSTSIKALLHTYSSKGLRIIEVYKHQMKDIARVVYSLKNRPYFYIIYMDDLSFEEDEIEYKYLKSIIEGGIEEKPSNVAIYATSNRRHLIKETALDNADDLHQNETQAEKLSLAYRFGLQIYYSCLSPKEFKEMVLQLAKKNKLNIEENILLREANIWELTYGSLSGRCATQFIHYLTNKYEKNNSIE